MAFYVVYIQEAHPTDAWQLTENVNQNLLFATPKTFDERVSVAGVCVKNLEIHFPALVDEISDSTERAYTAWPDRLYLVDKDGRVAYKSKAGPFGFNPRELERELAKLSPVAKL